MKIIPVVSLRSSLYVNYNGCFDSDDKIKWPVVCVRAVRH